MVVRRPLVLVSGQYNELLPGDSIVVGGGLIAGSGLSSDGDTNSELTVDVSLATNASGLIFADNKLGVDGAVQPISDNAIASGVYAVQLSDAAIASGTAAISLAVDAIASGDAAISSLPGVAGGSVIQQFNTASTVASGYAVGLDDLGKVQSVIYSFDPKVRDFDEFDVVATSAFEHSIVYASTPDRYVFVYRDSSNSSYGTAIVGEYDGSSWTFATPQVFSSNAILYTASVYDSSNDAVVITYNLNGTGGVAIVGAFSGTTLSFGTEVTYQSGDINYPSICYDSTNEKVVIAYEDDGGLDHGKAVVGTVSGSSISFGAVATFEANRIVFSSIVHDSTNNKIVIAYEDDNNFDYGTAVVGTVSGTSISFGTPVVFVSISISYNGITFDPTSDKVVIAFTISQYSNKAAAVVGTVSGTSISFGDLQRFNDEVLNNFYTNVAYDSVNNYVSIVTELVSAISQTLCRVSGDSLIFEDTQNYTGTPGDYVVQVFNPNTQDFVFFSRDSSILSVATVSSRSLSGFPQVNGKSNFIGIAQGNAASGDVVDVRLPGSIDSNNTGLTVGSQYFVDPSTSGFTTNPTTASGWNGAVTWGSVGYSVSSSSLILTDML